MNPYKTVSLYTQEMIRKYKGETFGALPPHIFTIADEAYNLLQEDSRKKSILIRYFLTGSVTLARKQCWQFSIFFLPFPLQWWIGCRKNGIDKADFAVSDTSLWKSFICWAVAAGIKPNPGGVWKCQNINQWQLQSLCNLLLSLFFLCHLSFNWAIDAGKIYGGLFLAQGHHHWRLHCWV